jgi:hypothetical protein
LTDGCFLENLVVICNFIVSRGYNPSVGGSGSRAEGPVKSQRMKTDGADPERRGRPGPGDESRRGRHDG